MNTKKVLVKNWIEKAEKDLLSAEREATFQYPVIETICFHCQQAAEKFLKGYLIQLDIPFRKTHEIGERITLIEKDNPGISELKDEADSLSDYAVEIRYPDDLYEPNLTEAHSALRITRRIREFVLNHI